jgi:hypothetical protein
MWSSVFRFPFFRWRLSARRIMEGISSLKTCLPDGAKSPGPRIPRESFELGSNCPGVVECDAFHHLLGSAADC